MFNILLQIGQDIFSNSMFEGTIWQNSIFDGTISSLKKPKKQSDVLPENVK